MFITIKKRLELLTETQKKVNDNLICFDPEKPNFGFKRMEQLFPVVQDEIKGYPCFAYNKFLDPVKFGIKIIPLELKYENSSHPCRIEISLLREFTKLVTLYVTPHITFFFKEMSVPNKKKSLTRFPLKTLRKEIFKESNVLVAEYVPGGSIEEWIQEQPNISEKQWKYIIFSVAWTLLVLQDKYQFVHNDFHYGNILIDTSIDPVDKSFIQYQLSKVTKKVDTDNLENDDGLTFNVQNVGLLPKIWDFEFASTYSPTMKYNNEFFKKTEENIPHEFNPYYDLHCFLTSLLELDIPDRLRDFILDLYPEEVIPPLYDEESDYDSEEDDCSTHSSCSGCSDFTGCDKSGDRKEEYYKTDESTYETSEDDQSNTDSEYSTDDSRDPKYTTDEDTRSSRTYYSTDDTDSSLSRSTSQECKRRKRRSYNSSDTDTDSYYSNTSELRTEYMLGDRMLNGTEKIFDLPTPLDILYSDYFSEYRKPLSRKAKVDCVFKYEMNHPYAFTDE